MRGNTIWIILVAAGFFAQISCDHAPPPDRVPVPTSANPDQMRPAEYVKPLPPEDNRVDLRVPNQPIPEPAPSAPSPPSAASPAEHSFAEVQRDFLDAYRQVGQPHMVVFVNHTLEGQLITPTAPEPWLASQPDQNPAATYLRPDQYDQASAKNVDYAAIENRLMEWLSNNGKVTVAPSASARQKLSGDQIKQLQSGRADALGQLDADIFVQAQVHAVQQTQRGLQLHLSVEAVNTKDGQAIAHASAAIGAPANPSYIENATKSAARDLMVGMIKTWTAPGPGGASQPAPSAAH